MFKSLFTAAALMALMLGATIVASEAAETKSGALAGDELRKAVSGKIPPACGMGSADTFLNICASSTVKIRTHASAQIRRITPRIVAAHRLSFRI